jgi:multicomponent Na+:H+ antiporter subunit C
MTLLISLTVAVLFAAAAYLMLKRDLIRVITGMILLGNAANLFIMAAGLRRGSAPYVSTGETTADSMVQAMTLTAIVISFGVATLVLAVVYRVYDSHHSVDLRRLGSAEAVQSSLDDQPTEADLPSDVEDEEALDEAAAERVRQ